MKKLLSTGLVGLLLTACMTTISSDITAPASLATAAYSPRANDGFLTQQQAIYRAERVSNVHYRLHFDLSNEVRFHGVSTVDFDYSGHQQPITIDLNQAEIHHLRINGQQVKPDYNQWFITLPAAQLRQGPNTIEIDYSRDHNSNGEGLHRFKDPVDGRVYLYSHFEPTAASQMFAVFDQPDLKARYEISVNAPADWTVISTVRESHISPQGATNRWQFGSTDKLSSYNFSMHAGPYKVWQDNSGKYPLRVLARQSVADKVKPQYWFDYSQKGLAFFEKYFDIPYPFTKYDHVLVPEFLYGAMENAAAITYAEQSYLSDEPMTETQKEQLAVVLLHEMAHQWFGNLVTMKWWNGLWLNESFAAFMEVIATEQAAGFSNAWRTFYTVNKQQAYQADQQVSTHPIEVPVPSTSNAFDNIDAITYAKGAAALQQLRHLLGPENFRLGVHHYLKEFAYKNATLDDFITSLAKTANRDLSEWQHQWLYQASLNTIKADYRCDNGYIQQFSIVQTAPVEHPTLREQKINIALFDRNGEGKIQLNQTQAVIFKGSNTPVNGLIGQPCPALVYPNYQDWAFVKVTLDSQSFHTAKSSLNQFSDPLLRSMLWQSLWDSTEDSLLPLDEFIDVVIANAGSETDMTILNQVIRTITTSNFYIHLFEQRIKPSKAVLTSQLETFLWQNVMDTTKAVEQRTAWFDAFVTVAASPQSLYLLSQILCGQLTIEPLTLPDDKRWRMIHRLHQYRYPNSTYMVKQAIAADNSEQSQRMAIIADTVYPDIANKRQWLAKIQSDTPDLPFAKLRIAMFNLFPASQYDLRNTLIEDILGQLPALEARKGPLFMRNYNAYLLRTFCSASGVKRLEQAISEFSQVSEGTRRALLESHQQSQRCVKMAEQMADDKS